MEGIENVSLAGSIRPVDAVHVVDVIDPSGPLRWTKGAESRTCQVEGCLIAERSVVLKRESKEVHE